MIDTLIVRGVRSHHRRTTYRSLTALALAATFAAATSATAAVGFWNGGSGEWTTPSNWSTNAFPNGVDDIALFEATGSSPIVTLASPVTVGTLIFDAPSTGYRLNPVSTGALTFSSTTSQASLLVSSAVAAGSTSLNLGVTLASDLAVTNNATGALAFTGNLSGNGNLILNGAGEVDLRGTNSAWTPTSIFVNAGLLSSVSGNLTAFGDPTTGSITVKSGASLDFSGIITSATTTQFTKTLTLSGAGTTASPGALSFGATTSTLLGPIILSNGAAFNGKTSSALLNVGDPTGAASNASLSGTGPLTKVGTGILQLNIPASYTGGTTVNAGTLAINTMGSLVGTGNVTINTGGKLSIKTPAGSSPASNSVSPNAVTLNGGTLSIAADISLANLLSTTTTSGILSLDTGTTFTAGGTNTIDLSGLSPTSLIRIGAAGTATLLPASLSLIPDSLTHTLHFGGVSGTLTINSAITDVGGNPTNLEFSSGNQTITLGGSSSYTGSTVVNSNVSLSVTSSTPLGSSSAGTTINGGTLTMAAASAEPFILNGGNFFINAPTSGPIVLNAGSTTVNQPNTSPITFNGGLLTLSAATTQTITQTAGTLTITAFNTAPLFVSGGIVNMTTSAGSGNPMTLTGGTVSLSSATSGPITLASGGLLKQLGSFGFQTLILTGGSLSLSTNISLSSMLNPASTGGIISIDTSLPFTSGADNALDFSTLPGGAGISIGASDVAIIGAAGGGTVLKPDNTTHTLHFGGVGLPGTVRINTVVTDFSAVATNLSVAFPSAVTLLKANTYTGITTVNGSILVSNALGLGTGSGTDADGTIVNPGGQLSTSAGITIANEKITVTSATLAVSTMGPVVVNGTGNNLSGTYAGPITGNGDISVSTALTFTGPIILAGQLFILPGGSVNSGANSLTTAAVTQSGGTLAGSALNINGLYTWSGGTLTGTNTIPAAGMAISGVSLATLNGGKLTNAIGQSTTMGAAGNGSLLLQSSATFINAGTFTANNGGISNTGTGNLFNNTGTFIVSDTSSAFSISSPFNNSGAVNVQSGALSLGGGDGGSTIGSFNVATGATLTFNGGTYNFSAPSSIGGGGVVNLSNGNVNFNGSFTLTGTTNVSGGTLSFGGNTAIQSAFSQSGGIVTGGSVTLNGLYTWSNGTLTQTNVTAAGGISIPSTSQGAFLINGTLTNPAGQTTTLGSVGSGSLSLQNGGIFNNAGTFNVVNGLILSSFGSGTGNFFKNTGIFNVNGSAFNNSTFVNSGTVNVQGGTLTLAGGDGGSTTGAFNVSPDATLLFNGVYSLTNSSSISGGGTVSFATGTTTTNGTFNVTGNTSVLSGAVVTGSLTIGGLLTLSGGTLLGSTVLANGGASIFGFVHLDNTTLTNAAGQTATIDNAGGGLILQNGATFINAGTITAISGNLGGTPGNLFINTGTFNAAASGSTFSASPFINSGNVNVQAGTLSIGNDTGSTDGIFNVLSGATLTFNGARTLASGSTLSGLGTVNFAGGTVNVDGVYNVTGTTIFSGGSVNFNNTITSLSGTGALTVSGGTVNFGNNNLSVPSVTQSGGMIVADSITINGLYNWSGGTLTATNAIAIGGISIPGNSAVHLNQGTLTNYAGQTATFGTISTFGGDFLFHNSAVFVNQGTFNIASASDITFIPSTSPVGVAFRNGGTLNFTGAGQFNTLYIYPTFVNSGTVNVLGGRVILGGGDAGSTSGSFFVFSGTTLEFDSDQSSNGYNLTPASSISGAGMISFAGNVALNGIYNVTGNTLLRYGTLSGNSLTTGGLFIFASGFLNVANTVANAGISLTPDPQTGGPYSGTLTGTVTNPAGQTAVAGTTAAIGTTGSGVLTFLNGGIFNNAGTFTAVQGQIATVGNGNLFNNTGTFISACTAGTYTIDAPFSNSGIVNVQSGTFTLDGSVQQLQGSALTGGAWNVLGNSTLILPTSITINQASVTLSGSASTFAAIAPLANNQGSFALQNGRNFTTVGDLANSGSLIVGAGSTLTVSGLLTANGGTIASSGAVVVNAGLSVTASTSLTGGGTLRVAGPFSISPSTFIDMTNNTLIVQASDLTDKANKLATLQNQIAQAEGDGTWSGTGGITSSTVAADNANPLHTLGLALADNATLGYTTFAGQSVDNNSLIIMATHIGDATLDGRIDIQDLNKVTAHWQQTGLLWSDGDTTGPSGFPDGKADIQDLNAVTANWQFGVGSGLTPAASSPLSPSSVPEPASLTLLALAAPALLRRRRHSHIHHS